MTERLRQLPVRPTARCASGRRLSLAFPLSRGKKKSGMPVFTEAPSFCIYSTARNPPSSSGPHELVHRMTGTHTGCLTLGRVWERTQIQARLVSETHPQHGTGNQLQHQNHLPTEQHRVKNEAANTRTPQKVAQDFFFFI